MREAGERSPASFSAQMARKASLGFGRVFTCPERQPAVITAARGGQQWVYCGLLAGERPALASSVLLGRIRKRDEV